MENTAKLLVALLLVGIWSCDQESPKAQPPVNLTKLAAPAQPSPPLDKEKKRIGDHLYEDTGGTVFLKVKNRDLMHPSIDLSHWPDSIYLSSVFVDEQDSSRPLRGLVHKTSFVQVNSEGTYWSDSGRIYVYAIDPLPVQFFSVPRNGSRFLGEKKEYLLQGGTLYSNGVVVKGLNNKHLSIIRYKQKDGNGLYEFITDGHYLFYKRYPLDEEMLSQIENLTNKDRSTLRKFIPKNHR